MSNLSINDLGFNENINFIEKNIGGTNQDTSNSFNNQSNILANNNYDYQRLLDYNNKIENEKNKNDNYVEKLDNEKRTTVYRINNFPTYVDDINFSNPVIYPKDYNMYFDYLQKKNIDQINTQVVKKKKYINIDSANRNIDTFVSINKFINLENNSIEFTNNSNYFKIYIDKAPEHFKQNDYIILKGFRNYVISYERLNFFFKNNSSTVILDIKPNFIDTIPYYDIFIKITGVQYKDKNIWKNIPLNLINDEHKINISEINGETRMSFELPILFYTENDSDKTLISNCIITYFSIGNYPINLVNSNTPLNYACLNPYLIVNDVQSNFIQLYLLNTISLNNNILLDGIWINNDTFITGINIQIGIINGFVQGYPNPNNFVINLENSYNNVCSIKMISSEIPNVTQNITDISTNNNQGNTNSQTTIDSQTDNNLKYISKVNNKFYWNNIVDIGTYFIELEQGYYSYPELKKTIENKISNIKRVPIFKDSFLYEYNIANVDFNTETNITKIIFYNLYIRPECLDAITELNNETNNNNNTNSGSNINIIDNIGNDYIIRIYHINHNLKVGDKIYITDSTNYYYIKSDYINTNEGHMVIKIINNNFYEIKISNINKIENIGNTKGGNNIKIKSPAIFRLFFNFPDTFGNLIGFSLSGLPNSITSYSCNFENYIVNNIQPYYNNIKKILVVNNSVSPFDLGVNYNKENYRYILLQCENLNNNYNPNGPSYFYKFLLNGQPNSYLFNTFVQTPIYFNPPLKTLTNLKFTYILPNGSLVNFGNLNNSFTLEITTIDNIPENTNISTYIGRV